MNFANCSRSVVVHVVRERDKEDSII